MSGAVMEMTAVTASTPFEELPARLTVEEVAVWYRKSPRTIRRWIEAREIRAEKLGNCVFVHKEALAGVAHR